MDYYLSIDLIEPEGAEAHYSEKLLRGRTLLAYHTRPPLPAVLRPREAFGFRADQHLYACLQNLRKFHPDFDPLLAGILERDPAGVVVIVEDRGACLAPMLRRRLARTMPEVLDRVVFLPHQSYADYLCLVAAADVVLDPLYYSGGTTTYEAFSLGKPIVTWPWGFQIGRGVLAGYRKMGIAGFVASDAEDYVRMAVVLGTDAEYRQDAGREISAASGELFEEVQAVREYEQIFSRLVEEARCR
jgi:predicted O-linked N-acetylglucosamine transferase (SPINDLY family)